MNKFLVYKISGGMNHMLKQINNSIHISEMTKRKLIIDTRGGAFDRNFKDFFYVEDFEYYTDYEVLKHHNLYEKNKNIIDKKVKKLKDYYIEDKNITLTLQEILDNKEEVVFFGYLRGSLGKRKWRIKVKEEIISRIKNIEQIKSDYIGVHYRNTDMKTELSSVIENIKRYEERTKIVYLATDDISSIEKIKILLPGMEVKYHTIPFDAKGKNIHYGNPNKDEVIINALIDLYFLKNSTYFIGSPGSSFSERVRIIRENDELFS